MQTRRQRRVLQSPLMDIQQLLNISTLDALREAPPNVSTRLRRAWDRGERGPIFALLETATGRTFGEKVARLLQGDPRCLTCGSPATFKGPKNGFAPFCSRSCAAANPDLQSRLLSKRRQTMLARYGATSTLSSPALRQKVDATMLERHGTTNAHVVGNTARTTTMLERYGVTVPSKNTIIAQRAGTTRRARALERHVLAAQHAGYTLVGDWTHVDQETTWRCHDGHTFTHVLATAQRLPICRACHPALRGTSNQEQELAAWVEQLGHEVQRNHRIVVDGKRYLELDIYLPAKRLAIEFNGLFWHSELAGRGPRYHLDKLEACSERGIQLVQVFEHELEHRPVVVHSVLLSKLGQLSSRLQARRLRIERLAREVAAEWFDRTHLAGNALHQLALGLHDGARLVAAASFSRQRFGRDKTVWELVRFSTEPGVAVAGGLSRLVTAAQRLLGFRVLRSFCDRRWGTGSGYLSAGFTKVGVTTPTYWYFTLRPTVVQHRTCFQKRRLQQLMPGVEGTEWQLAQLHGLNRFWDCGHIIFERTYQ